LKADIIHDYDKLPEQEIQTSKQAIKESKRYSFVKVIIKEDYFIGIEESVNIAIVLYKEVKP